MSTRPTGFAAYWDNLDAELSLYPPAAEMFPLDRHSTEEFNVSLVRLTSIGPYRVSAYVSIPSGQGPFPALIQTPRYGSVNHIPDYTDRLRYVCLTLHHRGQRLSDQPYQAKYPGLLTDGVEDPETYIYRGVAADCLRAAEFVYGHPNVDRNRVAIVGDDLALITAARRPGASCAIASNLMFYRIMESRPRTQSYPVEEINDWLRKYPDQEPSVRETLSFFDPQHHGSEIKSEILFSVGDEGSLSGREWLDPLVREINGNVVLFEQTHRGGEDRDQLDAALAERFDVQPASRFQSTVAPPFRAT